MKYSILLVMMLTLTGCIQSAEQDTTCQITQHKVTTTLAISENNAKIEVTIPNVYMSNIDLSKTNKDDTDAIFRQFIESQGFIIKNDDVIESKQNDENIIISVNQSKTDFENSLVQKYDFNKKDSYLTILKDNGYTCK